MSGNLRKAATKRYNSNKGAACEPPADKQTGVTMAQKPSNSSLDQQIDENLRKVFQRTVEEEVPDKLLDLLKQLKEQDQTNGQ